MENKKYFEWDQVPEGFDWVAVDMDGEVWAYMQKPIQLRSAWIGDVQQVIDDAGEMQSNWRELLFQRPTANQ